ncbi:hypothetical protein EC957_011763 [Mortierella hygrophila]|uniref:Uncharacterized protein n=1 Tax=Mortierella hygrophila TaxID=979708 RepID=A0A9P6F855_9FUNG|nr:hypothetical protein EC957_011763 [Mortierella hygrophila]
MVVQKQRRPKLILLLATALLLQGALAAHKINSPSSSTSSSSSLASSSNTNTNNSDINNLDIDESFQLKAKKEHKKIAGVDLDAAAEAIEKAVGPRAMAAAKKKADKFLADHKKKKGDKKDKGDDKKMKKGAVAAKKNKGDDGEEEVEEDIAISTINNEKEEENDIPMNIDDVQDYLSDMWEDIKDLGKDAAIQDQLQSLKESDEIQAQIAQLQSLGDDNPEILDRIEKLREGLDPEVREGIERVEEGVRKAAKQLGKRHFWHRKDVQRLEDRLEDSEATGDDGFETDVDDAGDETEMKGQAAAKKNRKHQHQKGGAHEEAEEVGGGQKNKKHDRDFQPTKQHRYGKHGQRGHRHAKKVGTGNTKNNGKGKKHAVRRKGKGGTIRDGHPGTPPVVVPEPVAVPASASAPVKNNGRRPDGHRHRHHHHRKHREGNHKGRQHPGAGDETKGPNPPVHTVPTPPPITLPIEVPLKDATPTDSTVPKPQEPPSSPASETPKEPVVDDTTFPLVDTPTRPSKPITQEPVVESPKAESPAETTVETVFPTEQPLQQQQPEAPKDEKKQQNKDREVQQLSPKPEEISPPAPVLEKQQPGDIVVVTLESDLKEKNRQQPADVNDLQRLPYPVDHQLPRVPGTSNNGDAQTPMAAPVLEPEQKEVPKVKEPTPASQLPGTAPKSSDSVATSEPVHESDPAEAVAAPSSPIAIPDLSTTPPRTPASANDKKPLKEDNDEDGEDDEVEDDEDGGEWDEGEDEDEEVGGGAAVKVEKDAAAVGVGAGLHKRQILAIGVFGVKEGVVDNKAAAAKNDPQQQQQQRREKKGPKVKKEDKKAQQQESTGAVGPIAKVEGKKKDKAQVVEANMAKDGDNKHAKDDNLQQQQQRQQDRQKEKENVVATQANKKEKKKTKNKKQQQRKEVEQRMKDGDDFVEEEKADVRNEDDITNPRPTETNDDAANFENHGRQKGKKNKKDREKKKNRQVDNESVGQDQNDVADVTVNEDQNAVAAVNPFEVGAIKIKKAHKKHKKDKNHHNQDQIPKTIQADALPAAVDPFAIKNNGGAAIHMKGGVYKMDTNGKDADVQQQQDDKSKNEKPSSAPPSNNNSNKDPKAIAGTPSVPMSGGGPADRKAPNSPANSGPAGAGPVTPPKEGKDATAIGGGENGYGTVPMFGPAQLDLGSGGVASSRLMMGGQWVASLSVAVLATVFMYL